jgi:hypothetical protein
LLLDVLQDVGSGLAKPVWRVIFFLADYPQVLSVFEGE